MGRVCLGAEDNAKAKRVRLQEAIPDDDEEDESARVRVDASVRLAFVYAILSNSRYSIPVSVLKTNFILFL